MHIQFFCSVFFTHFACSAYSNSPCLRFLCVFRSWFWSPPFFLSFFHVFPRFPSISHVFHPFFHAFRSVWNLLLIFSALHVANSPRSRLGSLDGIQKNYSKFDCCGKKKSVELQGVVRFLLYIKYYLYYILSVDPYDHVLELINQLYNQLTMIKCQIFHLEKKMSDFSQKKI